MKTIPNPSFTLKAQSDDKQTATAADLLKLTLTQPPQGGFDFATMRARNHIADVIEKTKRGAEIKLEDADFAVAKKCVEDYRWGGNHPDILKFAELFGL